MFFGIIIRMYNAGKHNQSHFHAVYQGHNAVFNMDGNLRAQHDYTLLLTFINGEHRIYNARPLLEKELFSALRSLPFFLHARAAYGTVIWNDDIDIAPEHLYKHSIPIKSDKIA